MRLLGFLGKLLVSLGVGVLLFVAWTLWGTGIYTEREQARLAEEFAELPEVVPTGTGGTESQGPPPGFAPDPGAPVFRIRIPKIDVDDIVVEGVDTEPLKLGPGHYPRCREGFELCQDFREYWPGEDGRVIISGHRTTYGAPFWDLDKVGAGDSVMIQTKWGTFEYRVTETEIVTAGDRAIVIPGDSAELVLTTCNPRYSAEERLIVYAELEESA